jgi:hypothetical protein
VIGQPFPEHDPVLVVRFEVADARDEEAPDRIIVVHVAGQGGGTRPSACRQRCWFSAAFIVAPRPSFDTLISRLFRDGVQFCSGLVDLVVYVRCRGCGAHRGTFPCHRFVWSPRTSRRWAITVLIRVYVAAVRGSNANRAMIAAGSWRPSRSDRSARTTNGIRIIVVLQESR